MNEYLGIAHPIQPPTTAPTGPPTPNPMAAPFNCDAYCTPCRPSCSATCSPTGFCICALPFGLPFPFAGPGMMLAVTMAPFLGTTLAFLTGGLCCTTTGGRV